MTIPMKPGILLLFFLLLGFGAEAQTKKEILYVGTFSVRGSQGIYALSLDRVKRTMKVVQVIPSLESPSYLNIHPSGKFLYSVNRGNADVSDHGGSVSAYGLDPKTGRLSGLNNRPSYGDGPCYVTVDGTGQYLFISHYNTGNLVVLPLFDDGLIGNPSDAKKYVGSSVDTARQNGPHVHSAIVSPDNKYLYVSDLGTDKIYIYKFIASNGTLAPAEMPEIMVNPGSGPRHFTFHPSGNFAYLAEELTSSVCSFAVNKTTGALTILQDTVKALPENFKGTNTSADIHTDIRGKYLFMSNRGHNSISIFSIAADGKIKLLGHQPTGGKTPRNFLVDPKGEFLFVANQDSDSIIIFRFMAKTGKLIPVGKPAKIPSPVCLKLVTLK
jgi:6-phosphogluconolactonase